MKYPRLETDAAKLKRNALSVIDMVHEKGITVAAVTKGFCALKETAEILKESGADFIADSRIDNLKILKDIDLPKIMLRLPMISEAEETVMYSDISFNSEIETIKALDVAAGKMSKKHGVVLMADLGDLREGYTDPDELIRTAQFVLTLKNTELKGIGVNFTCFAGVIPDEKNLKELTDIKERLKKELNYDCEIVSGGNSSSMYPFLEGRFVSGVNNLRLGEALLFGNETVHFTKIPGTVRDVFTLKAEIVELKVKPSVPRGNLGPNAFGKVPEFPDRGLRKMAICAVGIQDIEPEHLKPLQDGAIIKGASSDHMIIDVTECKEELRVGSIMSFTPDYAGMLKASTSAYVTKAIVYEDGTFSECI